MKFNKRLRRCAIFASVSAIHAFAAVVPTALAQIGAGMGGVVAGGIPSVLTEAPLLRGNGNTILLEPVGGATTIAPAPGIDPFFIYFNMLWPWIIGIASGIAVLQALIGGIQIMLSGGDSGKREEGKNRLLWALAGLLMISLSGLIMATLNASFYTYS